MNYGVLFASASLICATLCAQDLERNFAGVWDLNEKESEIRPMPVMIHPVLRIKQEGHTITHDGGAKYNTDGSETRFQLSPGTTSITRTKWEGRSLMINSLVTGPRSFSVNDRWTLSKDRNTLRIRRQITSMQGEVESNLVYLRQGSDQQVSNAPRTVQPSPSPASTPERAAGKAQQDELTYTITSGTKIPLRLINAVSTKTASEGDRIYLQTAFPIMSEGRIVIPPGSAVTGTVTSVKRPGRVKGRGELYLRFDSLSLPNGVTRDFKSRPGGLDGDTGATLDREEGKIQSPGTKGDDARKAGQAAGTGAAIGSIAGSVGGRGAMGAGIGAAAGAAGGLAGVLLSRGEETVLPRGAILEMVTDRPIVYTESELKPPGSGR
jgi:type IV secretion system protein VirB10